MILKIVEGVSSKDTLHVAKTAVNLSIFSKLSFFNYNFLKLPQKLKKPVMLVHNLVMVGGRPSFEKMDLHAWIYSVLKLHASNLVLPSDWSYDDGNWQSQLRCGVITKLWTTLVLCYNHASKQKTKNGVCSPHFQVCAFVLFSICK